MTHAWTAAAGCVTIGALFVGVSHGPPGRLDRVPDRVSPGIGVVSESDDSGAPRPVVRLLCGLAFAGKTTLARRIAERTGTEILSLDAINAERGLHGGTGIPVDEWARTHDIALERVAAALDAGWSVIVDDTNCFRWLRDDFRKVAARFGAEVLVVFVDVDLDEALRRAAENDVGGTRPPVRASILRELALEFEPPEIDEPAIVLRPSEPLEPWLDRYFPARDDTA